MEGEEGEDVGGEEDEFGGDDDEMDNDEDNEIPEDYGHDED